MAVSDGFDATLRHVLAVTDKIRRLEDARADAMKVLESLGTTVDSDELAEANRLLSAAQVPGRRNIKRMADAPPVLVPGDRFRRMHGERWPDLSLVPAVVYLLLSHEREVIYVGMSTNIRDRLVAHGGKPWRWVECIACESEFKALALEADLIYQHKPQYNVVGKARRGFNY